MRLYDLTEGLHDRFNYKAIFMAGGAGAGKSHVAKSLAGMTGMKYIDVDQIYELLSKQMGVDVHSLETNPDKQRAYDVSRALFDKRLHSLVSRGLGLIIDGTSRKLETRILTKQLLNNKGYDCALVYVYTNVDIAAERNLQRNRRVDPEFLQTSHKQVQQNLEIYKQIFGNSFFMIDNSNKEGYNIKELNRIQNWLKK